MQMKRRVQIWMNREDFVQLKAIFEAPDDKLREHAMRLWEEERGPLSVLHSSIEDAYCNNSNYDPE